MTEKREGSRVSNEPTRVELKRQIEGFMIKAERGNLTTAQAITLIENGHGLLVLEKLSASKERVRSAPILQALLLQDYVEEALKNRRKFPGLTEKDVVLTIHQIPEEGITILTKYRHELTSLPPKVFRDIFPDATPEEILQQSRDIGPEEIENLQNSLGLPYLLEVIDRFSIAGQKELIQKSIDQAPYLLAKNVLLLDDSLQIATVDHLLHSAHIEYEKIFSYPHFVDAVLKHLPHFSEVPKAVADKMLSLYLGKEVVTHIAHFATPEQEAIINNCLTQGNTQVILENFTNLPEVVQEQLTEKIIALSNPNLLALHLQNIPAPWQERALLKILAADAPLAASCIPKLSHLSNKAAEQFIAADLRSEVLSHRAIFSAYPLSSLFQSEEFHDQGAIADMLPELVNQPLELAEQLIAAGQGETVFTNITSFKDKFHLAIYERLAEAGYQEVLLKHLKKLRGLTSQTGVFLWHAILEERPPQIKMADLVTGLTLTPDKKRLLDNTKSFADHLEAVFADISDKRLAPNLRKRAEQQQILSRAREAENRPDLMRAKEIFGEDYLGIEAVVRAFNFDIPEPIPPIPFSKERLEQAKEQGQMLILRIPTSMEDLELGKKNKTADGKLLLREENDVWFKHRNFFTANTMSSPQWVLVAKEVEGKNKNYFEQTDELVVKVREIFGADMPSKYREAIDYYLGQRESIEALIEKGRSQAVLKLQNLELTKLCRRSAAEAFYDLILYYENTGKQLLKNEQDWTKDISSSVQLLTIRSSLDRSFVVSLSSSRPGDTNGDLGMILSLSE